MQENDARKRCKKTKQEHDARFDNKCNIIISNSSNDYDEDNLRDHFIINLGKALTIFIQYKKAKSSAFSTLYMNLQRMII